MSFNQKQPHITIKEIQAQETYRVRQPVLRAGRPFEDCVFENDTHPDTFHLGLFFKNNLIGVVTFVKTINKNFIKINQYQLRGMATLKEHQGFKYGDILVHAGESLVTDREGQLIWLKAQEVAVKFYERNRYKINGTAFNIPNVGTHYMMFKTL